MGVGELLHNRRRDIWAAVTTFPGRRAWAQCFAIYCIFAIVALSLGLATGFLQPSVAPLRAASIVLIALYLLVRPALLEELVFRALLLPHEPKRVRPRRLWFQAAGALLAFVVSHPLNGLLVRPAALGLFINPVFLLLSALLGVACTLAYLISRSLWPPVILHWVSVMVWIVFFGGQGLVGTFLRP
jgi:predicted Abi (CAAX) family protease